MIPSTPKAKTEWQVNLEDYAYHCISLMEQFARKEWGLPETWIIDASVLFTPVRRKKNGRIFKTSSYGGAYHSKRQDMFGAPFVKIQLGPLRYPHAVNRAKGNFDYREYGHIADDPIIGSILENKIWERFVAALCAHEVAHAIQHTANDTIPQDVDSWLLELPLDHEGHGEYWQSIYRVLREKFVNDYDNLPSLPDEARMKRPKRRIHKSIIGEVFIEWGTYRNAPVCGNFKLVKSWTPKNEYHRKWDSDKQKYVRASRIDFGEGKNGFVTIYLEKRAKTVRVTCDKDEVKETLYKTD